MAMNTISNGPAINPNDLPMLAETDYPSPFNEDVQGRNRRVLGEAFNLTNFGVNMVTLSDGAMSAQRHWHTRQDEFVYVMEGELVLITNAGEQILSAGMIAGFAAGEANGHHLVNRSGADAVYLEVGDRALGDECDYPDIDMRFVEHNGQGKYIHRDGTSYENKEQG